MSTISDFRVIDRDGQIVLLNCRQSIEAHLVQRREDRCSCICDASKNRKANRRGGLHSLARRLQRCLHHLFRVTIGLRRVSSKRLGIGHVMWKFVGQRLELFEQRQQKIVWYLVPGLVQYFDDSKQLVVLRCEVLW